MCAGLFGHLPYETPTFQATSPNLITHSISPLNTNSLQNKPSLLKGIFSLKSLQTKYSLLFTLVIHLLTHLSSSFADENICHQTKKRHTSHFRAHTALFRYFKYNTLNPYKTTPYGLKMASGGTLRYNPRKGRGFSIRTHSSLVSPTSKARLSDL